MQYGRGPLSPGWSPAGRCTVRCMIGVILVTFLRVSINWAGRWSRRRKKRWQRSSVMVERAEGEEGHSAVEHLLMNCIYSERKEASNHYRSLMNDAQSQGYFRIESTQPIVIRFEEIDALRCALARDRSVRIVKSASRSHLIACFVIVIYLLTALTI